MSVQARLYVAEMTRFAYNPEQAQVTLRAVSRGPENKTWASATPVAEFKMTIGNAEAVRWFEERLGKDVAVTFQDRPLENCSKCGGDLNMTQYQQEPVRIDDKPVCPECYQKNQS
jgi:formylmethanofuran dehydrogenase subunit E